MAKIPGIWDFTKVQDGFLYQFWNFGIKNVNSDLKLGLSNQSMYRTTEYGRPGRKFNPNPTFLGTAEAYFVCHIDPNFQISLIYAFIGCL